MDNVKISNKPVIRFKGFTEDWEQRKFEEILEEYNHKSKLENEFNLLSSTNCGMEIREGRVSGQSNIGYKVIYKNDLVLSPQNLWLGNININNLDTGIVSPSYKTYRFRNINTKFIEPQLRMSKLLESYKNSSTQGASVVRRNLDIELFNQIVILIPTDNEQIEIGKLFSTIDNLITLHQRKLDKTKELKKTMLSKLFPKNGEARPEIRFSGFTDAWEQRKFSTLAEYKKGPFGSAITKDMFIPKNMDTIKVYEQQNAIKKDCKLERYFLPKDYCIKKLKSFRVNAGDIIVSCAGTIGEIYELPENAESGIINQALMRVIVNNNILEKRIFIILFETMIDSFSAKHSNGSAIKNIPPLSDLKQTIVFVPNRNEQIELSNYFDNLDNLITLHQRELDQLKNMKKTMLKYMFV